MTIKKWEKNMNNFAIFKKTHSSQQILGFSTIDITSSSFFKVLFYLYFI